jgi:hypothetical protein
MDDPFNILPRAELPSPNVIIPESDTSNNTLSVHSCPAYETLYVTWPPGIPTSPVTLTTGADADPGRPDCSAIPLLDSSNEQPSSTSLTRLATASTRPSAPIHRSPFPTLSASGTCVRTTPKQPGRTGRAGLAGVGCSVALSGISLGI